MSYILVLELFSKSLSGIKGNKFTGKQVMSCSSMVSRKLKDGFLEIMNEYIDMNYHECSSLDSKEARKHYFSTSALASLSAVKFLKDALSIRGDVIDRETFIVSLVLMIEVFYKLASVPSPSFNGYFPLELEDLYDVVKELSDEINAVFIELASKQ